ncbi:MAG: Na+/H+ antiporter subunit E [Acidobacteria bacterium]|nr:Na+/H+ antiporter subunit E [Acidobacteriota bacterium]
MSRKRVSLRQELPLLIWLVLVWGALWRDFSPGNLIFGAIIAVLITQFLYLPPVELGGRFNVFHAFSYLWIFLFKVVQASAQVLYLAIFRGPTVRNAVVAVPLRSTSDLIITATGHATSLVPGSLVVEVDRSTSTLYLHAMDASTAADVEKVRREVRATEARIIRIMGTRAEVAALRAEQTQGGSR